VRELSDYEKAQTAELFKALIDQRVLFVPDSLIDTYPQEVWDTLGMLCVAYVEKHGNFRFVWIDDFQRRGREIRMTEWSS
jgi:hypothetical protein